MILAGVELVGMMSSTSFNFFVINMIEDCPDFKTAFKKVGGEELQPKTFQDAVRLITDALALMVISKNHKYGKKNINDLGQIGIFCRVYDKTSRLREHFVNQVELGKEGTFDSFADLAGYGVVDLLYEIGWYNLELKNEK